VVADVVRAPDCSNRVEAVLGDRLGGVLVDEPEIGLARSASSSNERGGARSAVELHAAGQRLRPAVRSEVGCLVMSPLANPRKRCDRGRDHSHSSPRQPIGGEASSPDRDLVSFSEATSLGKRLLGHVVVDNLARALASTSARASRASRLALGDSIVTLDAT